MSCTVCQLNALIVNVGRVSYYEVWAYHQRRMLTYTMIYTRASQYKHYPNYRVDHCISNRNSLRFGIGDRPCGPCGNSASCPATIPKAHDQWIGLHINGKMKALPSSSALHHNGLEQRSHYY